MALLSFPGRELDPRTGKSGLRFYALLDEDHGCLVPNVLSFDSEEPTFCQVAVLENGALAKDADGAPLTMTLAGNFRRLRWARNEDYKILGT